ncbi:TapY2 family type IVa secretion system protein [Shewanella sp. NIFS-20-20]|uniref:TapY2 family type IVa secretion system protein n=1 Tax=Shewanella sp. NIFS-20-20 TaxID=2853806 RepID=UPI001C48C3A5|nr:TapY2 family type IVa secretion system protein [Shewanella sp. NIFS-20-20]MBV7314177.1 TapY2 family type IVa secretion system protein [Shewanella sp. NIFS-20-20]
MKWLITMVLIAISANLSANTSASTNQHSERKDYKCFVETTVGNQIHFFSSKVKHTSKIASGLVATKIGNADGKGMVYIKDVLECVASDESFTLVDAVAKDEQTVR